MGTKNNPGPYDCYGSAHPDEPIFTFRANDPTASFLVKAWAYIQTKNRVDATKMVNDAITALDEMGKETKAPTHPKVKEAFLCAKAMSGWQRVKEHQEKQESPIPSGSIMEPTQFTLPDGTSVTVQKYQEWARVAAGEDLPPYSVAVSSLGGGYIVLTEVMVYCSGPKKGQQERRVLRFHDLLPTPPEKSG